jgi:hypothetical protein
VVAGRRIRRDIVAAAADGPRLLLGEPKWSARPLDARRLAREVAAVGARALPPLGERWVGAEPVRVLFVPELARGVHPPPGPVVVVTGPTVLRA